MLKAKWGIVALLVIIMSLTAISLSVLFRIQDLNRICSQSKNEWHTWQVVIDRIQEPQKYHLPANPPHQQPAADRYAQSLRDGVGTYPSC